MIHPIENWRTYDDRGVMMPWYTRPCLEWLDTYVETGMKVFEYGCGSSSLWYQSKNVAIYGVDSNEEWLFCRQQKVIHTEQRYITSINEVYQDLYDIDAEQVTDFDLIIIDGLYRDDCTEHALKALKKGGYLIADNFEQPSVEEFWPKTRELTKNLPLTIYKEPTHPDWKSAVWHNV